MLFKSGELKQVVMEKPRGGPGRMESRYAIQRGGSPEGSAFQLLAVMTLPPGSGMGYHQHVEDEEVYVILSGKGIFSDNGQEKEVGPGDMALTLKGESHGITNIGGEPLVFLAAVVKK